MTATEVIEAVRKLTPDERFSVLDAINQAIYLEDPEHPIITIGATTFQRPNGSISLSDVERTTINEALRMMIQERDRESVVLSTDEVRACEQAMKGPFLSLEDIQRRVRLGEGQKERSRHEVSAKIATSEVD